MKMKSDHDKVEGVSIKRIGPDNLTNTTGNRSYRWFRSVDDYCRCIKIDRRSSVVCIH